MARPRQTKIEKVRSMLTRPQGARLEVICKATGWQLHSARAAISGLRKSGYTIERQPGDDGKGASSTYRITGVPEAAE